MAFPATTDAGAFRAAAAPIEGQLPFLRDKLVIRRVRPDCPPSVVAAMCEITRPARMFSRRSRGNVRFVGPVSGLSRRARLLQKYRYRQRKMSVKRSKR
jgi:hypothetical protein